MNFMYTKPLEQMVSECKGFCVMHIVNHLRPFHYYSFMVLLPLMPIVAWMFYTYWSNQSKPKWIPSEEMDYKWTLLRQGAIWELILRDSELFMTAFPFIGDIFGYEQKCCTFMTKYDECLHCRVSKAK